MRILFDLITILGHTAAGKTRLAALYADRVNAEIISADSRQVYRGMDIGTGKDLKDYEVNGRIIPYHLIDIHNPGYHYNVFEFQSDFHQAYEKIKSANKTAILCGGTGMYIDAAVNAYSMPSVPANPILREQLEQQSHNELIDLLKKMNPSLHNTTDIDSKKRTIRAIEIANYMKENPMEAKQYPKINNLFLGIAYDRETRRKRITSRLEQRLEDMLKEVNYLLNNGTTIDDLLFYGLEYKYMTLYITRQLSYDTMVNQLETAIHQFAKRQMTWFRGMERKGAVINWINPDLNEEEKVEEMLILSTKLPNK